MWPYSRPTPCPGLAQTWVCCAARQVWLRLADDPARPVASVLCWFQCGCLLVLTGWLRVLAGLCVPAGFCVLADRLRVLVGCLRLQPGIPPGRPATRRRLAGQASAVHRRPRLMWWEAIWGRPPATPCLVGGLTPGGDALVVVAIGGCASSLVVGIGDVLVVEPCGRDRAALVSADPIPANAATRHCGPQPPAGQIGSRTGGSPQLGSKDRANLDVDVESRPAGPFFLIGGVLVAVKPL